MRNVTPDLARAIERLKEDNDFVLFVGWMKHSFGEKILETIRMDKDHVQVGQGYSQALDDILAKVETSRETLDRFNKHRDTR